MKKGMIIGIIAIVVVVVILGYFYFVDEKVLDYGVCAGEGEQFSFVYIDEYPETCCEGLTDWDSGMDTSLSIGDNCYDTMMLSGYPVGTCINCGNGVCEDIEDVCNCPDDCSAENSRFVTVEDFCGGYAGDNTGLAGMCQEDEFDLPICKLCNF